MGCAGSKVPKHDQSDVEENEPGEADWSAAIAAPMLACTEPEVPQTDTELEYSQEPAVDWDDEDGADAAEATEMSADAPEMSADAPEMSADAPETSADAYPDDAYTGSSSTKASRKNRRYDEGRSALRPTPATDTSDNEAGHRQRRSSRKRSEGDAEKQSNQAVQLGSDSEAGGYSSPNAEYDGEKRVKKSRHHKSKYEDTLDVKPRSSRRSSRQEASDAELTSDAEGHKKKKKKHRKYTEEEWAQWEAENKASSPKEKKRKTRSKKEYTEEEWAEWVAQQEK